MAINKNFFIERKTIQHNGQDVCDVRGVSPDDIAQVMAENAADMEVLFETWEKDKVLSGVNVRDDVELSKAFTDNSTKMVTTILTAVPSLAAKIIAMACDEPENWTTVKTWVVPLQFDILREIAVLTFVDKNGFKAFLGNVMALVGSVSETKTMGETKTTKTPPLRAVTTG